MSVGASKENRYLKRYKDIYYCKQTGSSTNGGYCGIYRTVLAIRSLCFGLAFAATAITVTISRTNISATCFYRISFSLVNDYVFPLNNLPIGIHVSVVVLQSQASPCHPSEPIYYIYITSRMNELARWNKYSHRHFLQLHTPFPEQIIPPTKSHEKLSHSQYFPLITCVIYSPSELWSVTKP